MDVFFCLATVASLPCLPLQALSSGAAPSITWRIGFPAGTSRSRGIWEILDQRMERVLSEVYCEGIGRDNGFIDILCDLWGLMVHRTRP